MAQIRGATWDDFDGIFDLLDRRSRAAFGVSELQSAFVRQEWELPTFEVGRDSWVAVDNASLVGYAALGPAHDLTHTAVEPEIGDELLARAEQRARERGFDHVTCIAVPEDEPLHALVCRNGFMLDREIRRMWRTLNGIAPEPAWPSDVTVRSYEGADARRVHAALDDAYSGWDPHYIVRSHDDWCAAMTAHDDFDPALWFLVERDGELVGCALHWKEFQQRGWLKDIVVRESERGHGLGTALLQHAFRVYAERGVERVGLKVDSTNPTGAPRLYERLGFVTDRRYAIWLKNL